MLGETIQTEGWFLMRELESLTVHFRHIVLAVLGAMISSAIDIVGLTTLGQVNY